MDFFWIARRRQIHPPVSLAWCAHFYARSVEDALGKARYWNKSDPARMLERSDARFWSQVDDPRLRDRWAAQVAQGMRKLVRLEGDCPAAAAAGAR